MTTTQAIWLGVIIWVFGLGCFILGCWWATREPEPFYLEEEVREALHGKGFEE